MADTKLTALTALTAPGLDDLIYTVDDPAGTPASRKTTVAELMTATGLLHTAGPADANQTMAVGVMYVTDISGYTADRTFTLPATAAVGDRCGILLSAGDDAFELLITAAAGDTLNGVAGGTEWSRLFIVYECVIFRCVAASATWVVEHDGRIPQQGLLRLSTDSDGEVAGTYIRPTQTSTAGAWTADRDNASITSVTGDQIKTRRAGRFIVALSGVMKDAATANGYFGPALFLNGTVNRLTYSSVTVVNTVGGSAAGAIMVNLAIDDFIVFQYRSSEGGRGLLSSASVLFSAFSLTEVIP